MVLLLSPTPSTLSTAHYTPFLQTTQTAVASFSTTPNPACFYAFIGPDFCSDVPEFHRDRFLSVEPLESLAFQGTHVQINPLRSPFSSAAFNGEPSRMSRPRRLKLFRCRRHWSQTLSLLLGSVSSRAQFHGLRMPDNTIS